MADLTQFDAVSAGRIARVVRAVEQEPQRARPLTFDSINAINATRERALLCKTQSYWAKNTAATLNVWQSGSPPSETQTQGRTVEAVNKMHDVFGDLFVLVAKAGNGVWYLVQSSMPPVLSGTFSGAWGKSDAGVMKNVTVFAGSGSYTVQAANKMASIPDGDTRNCVIAYNGYGFVLIAAEC